MYKITFAARCPDGLNEVLSTELDNLALLVEARVSVALLEIFGRVIVDDVHVEYMSSEHERGQAPPAA